MKKCILYLFTILPLLSGCSDDTAYILANPTNNTFQVSLDDTTYDLGPHSSVNVKLAAGAHQLKSENTGLVDFTIYPNRNGGIINPTLSTYILVYETYQVDTPTDNSNHQERSTTLIGNKRYYGSLKKLNGLFIPEQWSYDLTENFPDKITISKDRSRALMTKIFSIEDFIQYHLNYYGQPINAQEETEPALTQVELFALNQAAALPEFSDPRVQSAAQPLRDFYKQYITTTDPEQQKTMQENVHNLMMTYTHDTAELSIKQNLEERAKMNDFPSIFSNVTGTSFLVTDYQ